MKNSYFVDIYKKNFSMIFSHLITRKIESLKSPKYKFYGTKTINRRQNKNFLYSHLLVYHIENTIKR